MDIKAQLDRGGRLVHMLATRTLGQRGLEIHFVVAKADVATDEDHGFNNTWLKAKN